MVYSLNFVRRRAAPYIMCCAVLCCAVLCCAVLCCAVLCCAVLCCAVLCCAVLCCAVLCCAVLCCAVLCCAVLCCAEALSRGMGDTYRGTLKIMERTMVIPTTKDLCGPPPQSPWTRVRASEPGRARPYSEGMFYNWSGWILCSLRCCGKG